MLSVRRRPVQGCPFERGERNCRIPMGELIRDDIACREKNSVAQQLPGVRPRAQTLGEDD
jgi:hypothetical protein